MRLISRVNSNIQSLNGDQLLTKLLKKTLEILETFKKDSALCEGVFSVLSYRTVEKGGQGRGF